MTESKTKGVRRTQEQIVADLEAKAQAARDKLNEKARKGYNATYARYLKALDSVVEGLAVAAQLGDSVSEQAEKLGIEDGMHYLNFTTPGDQVYDLVEHAADVNVVDAEGNEVTEDQG